MGELPISQNENICLHPNWAPHRYRVLPVAETVSKIWIAGPRVLRRPVFGTRVVYDRDHAYARQRRPPCCIRCRCGPVCQRRCISISHAFAQVLRSIGTGTSGPKPKTRFFSRLLTYCSTAAASCISALGCRFARSIRQNWGSHRGGWSSCLSAFCSSAASRRSFYSTNGCRR